MLTEIKIKEARATGLSYRLYDGRGLYLQVSPKGGKWWRLKYRYKNKENRISLGIYPDVSLKMARDRRDESRKILADNINPSEQRKSQKITGTDNSTFEAVSKEWITKNSGVWSVCHKTTITQRLDLHAYPFIGEKQIKEIHAVDLLPVIQIIEKKGCLETGHRLLINFNQIFRYAIATGRITSNPAADLKGALPPVVGEHFSAVIEPVQVGKLLKKIWSYNGSVVVKCALRFAPLVFVRPGELRKAKWKDIYLEEAEWKYHISKTNTPHIVPLSRQALEILKELKPLTWKGLYVFPGARNKNEPMSNNAILSALRRMKIGKEEMSGHGFRPMARTILDEVLKIRPDIIEHQLAHAVRGPNGRAYNRTSFLPERKEMMQTWADYLDSLI